MLNGSEEGESVLTVTPAVPGDRAVPVRWHSHHPGTKICLQRHADKRVSALFRFVSFYVYHRKVSINKRDDYALNIVLQNPGPLSGSLIGSG